jgi:hypothetical protein
MIKYLFGASTTSEGANGGTREGGSGRRTVLMTRPYRTCAIAISALIAGSAIGQTPDLPQPPDIVQSDSSANTAVGTLADAAGGGEANTAVGNSALQASGGQEPGGGFNTAVGAFAMFQNRSGSGNTAIGYTALWANSTGYQNIAVGLQSLNQNSTGYWNTASGNNSMISNTTGYNNTATGNNALACNTTGNWNTASGAFALSGSELGNCGATGSENTASGAYALTSNMTGGENTASGYGSLYSNTNGAGNTAAGWHTLYRNTTGFHDTATGGGALFSNTTGTVNTALGFGALFSNTTGSNNIAVGNDAGYNLTHGANNIEIGNEGTSSDGGMIRIGTSGSQTATYVAGIENTKVTGSAVFITSSGQLGVLASSERYKTAIAPMGAGTEKLQELRPVSFHLKTDANGPVQYGLIAEEVAKVYPELVIRDERGGIQGVRYEELAPMLLNEMQKEHATVATLFSQHETDAEKFDLQAKKIASLEQQLAEIHAAIATLQPKGPFVAQR